MKKYEIMTARAWEAVVNWWKVTDVNEWWEAVDVKARWEAVVLVLNENPLMFWGSTATLTAIVIMLYTLGFWAAVGVFLFVYGNNLEQEARKRRLNL